MLVDVRTEQCGALRVVENNDLHPESFQPVMPTLEVLVLADHHGADVELTHQARAVPARRERGDHDALGVVTPTTRATKSVGFGVHRRIIFLDPAVVTRSQQRAVASKERRADGDPALGESGPSFAEGSREHLGREGSIKWRVGLGHGISMLPAVNRGTYVVDIGSQQLELPIVSLNDTLALALLITVDIGVTFLERAGKELADVLEPYEVDIVATVATMGIPLAVEVTRHLGLDRYVVLHKTPKIHLADAVSEPVRSITTDAEQRLLFDRARIGDVRGKRVAIVDDVISTGASTGATLRLLRGVGADVVVIGTLVTEAGLWRDALGEDAQMVRALGSIPVFRPDGSGGLVEDWNG